MIKMLRLVVTAALLATLATVLPATTAQAGSGSTCTSWVKARNTGLKIRSCLSTRPYGSKQVAYASLQVKNTTRKRKRVSGRVSLHRVNSRSSSDSGTVRVPARSRRTVTVEVRYFRANHGRLAALGNISRPIRWGTYTATMRY